MTFYHPLLSISAASHPCIVVGVSLPHLLSAVLAHEALLEDGATDKVFIPSYHHPYVPLLVFNTFCDLGPNLVGFQK